MRYTALALALLLPSTACSLLPGVASRSAASTAARSEDQRSYPSTVEEREVAAAKAEAARVKTPYEQLCARTVDEAGPEPGPSEGDSPRALKKRWQPVVMAAAPTQFVAAKVALEVSHNYDHTKWLRRTIPAGEPLLLEDCFSQTEVRVRSIDGLFVKPVAITSLDLAPATFQWEVPPPPKKTTATARISDSHPDDVAAIDGLRALIDKRGECQVEATGQCMAAEKKIEQGPPRVDLAAAKQRACDAAVDKVFARCMGKAEVKRLDQLTLDLEKRTAKRVADLHAALRLKLAAH